MESQLTILLPVAAVWLAAGVVADGLPRLRPRPRAAPAYRMVARAGPHRRGAHRGRARRRAVQRRHHAGRPGRRRAHPGRRPARSWRRSAPYAGSAGCWAGAGAFASAPATPAPHGLRAAAAHPLVGLPLQVTALATVPALIAAAGADLGADPGVTGPAITVGALAVVAIGVRHALRHNRLRRAGPAGRRTVSADGWRSCTYSSSRIDLVASNQRSSQSWRAARCPSAATPSAGHAATGGQPGTRAAPSASPSAGTTARSAGSGPARAARAAQSRRLGSALPPSSSPGRSRPPRSEPCPDERRGTCHRTAPALPGPLVRLSEPIVVIRLAYSLGCGSVRRVVDQRRTDRFNEMGALWRRESRRNLAEPPPRRGG